MKALLTPSLIMFAAAACLGSASVCSAGPKAPAPLEKEPERFAFIIGNANYQSYTPKFTDLPDACTEALNFRAKLLSMHWKLDHIFPIARPSKPDESADDAVRNAVCNLSNKDLSSGLTRFIATLLINQNNPYGVFYYAGHGAESNDEVYAFGVDSDIDLSKEVSRVIEYSEYEPFSQSIDPSQEGAQAVDVTKIIKTINGPHGKALLVIFDACRNNPLIDSGAPVPGHIPENLTPDQKRRLSIGSVTYRPDKYDQSFRNIMMMFAGRPNQSVQSGTAADPNWFASNLQSFVVQPANQAVGTQNLVGDFEGYAKDSQRTLPIDVQQIPQHIGTIKSSPAFCLVGCAQRTSIWMNEETEVIQGSGAKTTAHLVTGVVNSRRTRGSMSTRHEQGPALIPVAYTKLATTQPLEVTPTSPLSNRTRRYLNLDVFYCRGDANDATRKQAARQFGESAKGMLDTSSAEDVYLDQIRLRSLDINENIALGHPKQENLLVLPRSEASWKGWRTRFSSGFQKSYADDVTKGFIRAYFCSGSTNKVVPSVYPEVAHADQKAHAAAIIASISGQVSGLKFEDVEPVDDTHPIGEHVPHHNEVRYYYAAQKGQAVAIASALSAHTSKAFVVRKGPLLGSDQVKNPTIEIWFGLEELASWI